MSPQAGRTRHGYKSGKKPIIAHARERRATLTGKIQGR